MSLIAQAAFAGLIKPQNSINPNSGVISHWKLDEASGANAIDSVGSNTLTPAGAGAVGSASGRVGTCRTFSSSYLTCADNPSLSLTGSMAITAWINPASNTVQYYVSKFDTSGNQRSYTLYRESNKIGFFVSPDGTTSVIVQPSVNLTSNVWNFLACGYNGTHIWISLNAGTIYTTPHTGGIFDSTAAFTLSGILIPAIYGMAAGSMDEVNIYNRSISAEEISHIFNGGAGRTIPY